MYWRIILEWVLYKVRICNVEDRIGCSVLDHCFCCTFYYHGCCHHSHGHCHHHHLSVYTAECDLFLESVLTVPKYDQKKATVFLF
jgi:hypothetical protein